MEDKALLQKLSDLQYAHAPRPLHEKVLMAEMLPEKHRGFYFPLFAFEMALVVLVAVVLVGAGSGVVLAAKGSNPGAPLYPVRQLLEKVVPSFVHMQALPATVPTSVPTVPAEPRPTGKPSVHGGREGENEQEREGVQGAQDTASQGARGAENALRPTISPKEDKENVLHVNKSEDAIQENVGHILQDQ